MDPIVTFVRSRAALLVNTIAIVALGSGTLIYVASIGDGTLVRNSLIVSEATQAEFDWTPATTPRDYDIEHLAPPPLFDSLARELLAGGGSATSELDRALLIVEHLNRTAGDGKSIRKDLASTYESIVESGTGYCADFTRTFAALAHAMDVPVREWGLGFGDFGGGHAFNEVYSHSHAKWVFIDPFHAIYARDRTSAQPLSVQEFREAVLSAPDDVEIVPIGPHFRFSSSGAAIRYYASAADYFYLFWGNNIYEYDSDPLVRTMGTISRAAERAVAVATGKLPRVRPLPVGSDANQAGIDEIVSLRRVLFSSLALFVVLAGLWFYQVAARLKRGSFATGDGRPDIRIRAS